MIRQHCSATVEIKKNKTRCGRMFRARLVHANCRACHKRITGKSRELYRPAKKVKVAKVKPVKVEAAPKRRK